MKKLEAAIVRLAPEVFGTEKDVEVKFGKTDKIVKVAIGPKEAPTGIAFIGRSGRVFKADISRYPASISGIMFFHGAKQKLGDEYADLGDEGDCFEAVIALDARLASGNWTAEREGFAGVSVLMQALMKVFGLSEEKTRDFLKPLTKKEKDALRVSPELKPAIDEIEKEKGKGADVTDLMGRLKALA